jgi:protoporphyrinogen/coproporphyrinogen III oxidase
MTAPVVVIGAGISGLATAYELHRRGLTPIVLEASDRPGGLILTERDGPFVIDAGPDSILASKPGGIALCEAVGLAERLIPTSPPRTSFVLRGGRLHALPRPAILGLPLTWRAAARASMLSPASRLRAALEPLVPARPVADESIGSFIQRRFGREAVDYIAEPLLAGIHAGDVDRLSVRALFPSLAEAEQEHGSVIRGLTRKDQPETPAQPEALGLFRSFPGGMGELVTALENRLPPHTIRLRMPTVAIKKDGGSGFQVVQRDETIPAAAVVVATPAWAAAEMLAPLDDMLSALCAGIPYTSSAIVTMAFDRRAIRDPLAGSGFVVPRAEGLPLLAATWISSKWPGRAPAETVLIRAFLGGARDPGAVDRSNTDLIASAIRALDSLGPLDGRPQLARVHRWRRASAQHEVGHLARLAGIEQRLQAWPGLFVTGSGFRATGLPDCIDDALAVAARVSSFLNAEGRRPKAESRRPKAEGESDYT